MKFLTEFFNSGTVAQQNKRRVGAMIIAGTAGVLAVTLIVLMIASIAIGINNNKPNEDEPAGDGSGIPGGYTTTTFEGVYSTAEGSLLLLDASHGYTGSKNTVKPDPSVRAKDENGTSLYRGDYGDILLNQETLDAFNAMMLAFHEAKKADAGYQVERLYLDSNLAPKSTTPSADTKAVLGSGTGLILSDQPLNSTENEVTIYDSETNSGKGVYAWIYENAHRYGFVRASNAEGEENIFRYVGVAHANYMKNNNKTVAEYLEALQSRTANKPLSFSAKNAEDKSVSYRVYYLAGGDEKVVPTDKEYTVSGDNMGGFIVTVDMTKKK